MEAMLAGCVPIVADWCGPAEFVTPDCGYKVAVSDPIKMATEISRILCKLDADRSLLRVKGDAASTRIRSSYSEAQFLKSMNKFFISATSRVPLHS
jgi:glycosyltransferase involved in cell wall biosynthesis